jgi:hypothetical protein
VAPSLIGLHAIDWVKACTLGSDKNLACGVVENLDCSKVKAAACNFVVAIITLGHFHSALSCHPACPEAPPVLHERRADSGMLGILAGTRSIDVRSSKRPGLKCLVGLRHTTVCHAAEPDPSGCRSQTRGQKWHMARPGART